MRPLKTQRVAQPIMSLLGVALNFHIVRLGRFSSSLSLPFQCQSLVILPQMNCLQCLKRFRHGDYHGVKRRMMEYEVKRQNTINKMKQFSSAVLGHTNYSSLTKKRWLTCFNDKPFARPGNLAVRCTIYLSLFGLLVGIGLYRT